MGGLFDDINLESDGAIVILWFSTVHMWLSSHDFGDRREKNYQPHEDHERLRDFKSYCFVGFVYISALGLSVFKVQCELVGKGWKLKKKKVNRNFKANNLIW